MENIKKMELFKESLENLTEGKKKVSALIITHQEARLFNYGSRIPCREIQLVLNDGKNVHEWHYSANSPQKNHLPDKTKILFWLKSGRVLVADNIDKDTEPTILVGGYDEEDDKLTILMHAHIDGATLLHYYNKNTQTPFIKLVDSVNNESFGILYQGIKKLLVKEGKKNEGNVYSTFFE